MRQGYQSSARTPPSRSQALGPFGDAIVRARPCAAMPLVVGRGMNSVRKYRADQPAIDVAPEARTGETEVPDRGPAEPRAGERSVFVLAVEAGPQCPRGARPD